VKDFAKEAFGCAGLNWEDYVETDPRFLRPVETNILRADASKAKTKLNWQPSVAFKGLVKIMVDHELKK
jgi:GDPmannose 4,6-dehydratase